MQLNNTTLVEIFNEQSRLNSDDVNAELSTGSGLVRFNVVCDVSAESVLKKAKEVLGLIDEATIGAWPALPSWKSILPADFLNAFVPEKTPEEEQRWLIWWRSLSAERQKIEADKWSLADWLYWMEPNNRSWFWWRAQILDTSNIEVAVKVLDWPFPWGALKILFISAGAKSVEAERDD
jgi:hypothetical protein